MGLAVSSSYLHIPEVVFFFMKPYSRSVKTQDGTVAGSSDVEGMSGCGFKGGECGVSVGVVWGPMSEPIFVDLSTFETFWFQGI